MSFLPETYEVPSSGDKYMKFKPGENKIRILSSPILGHVWWIDAEGSRKPVRVKMGAGIPVEFAEEVKHFWAMPVWNYQTEKVQVLEITQKSIQKAIRALSKDEDWGAPTEYDIVISKSGDGLDTEYQVTPKPAKKVSTDVEQAYLSVTINLNALYEGGDPFTEKPKTQAEKVADEIPF